MRRRTSAALIAAIALSVPVARLAGQSADLRLTMNKLPPGTIVRAETGGTTVPQTTATATAGSNGALDLALAIGSAGKLTATFDAQFDVYVGDCPDKSVRVYLIEHGVEPPPECNRRMIGAFWWHKTHSVAVRYPGTLATGGLSMGMKVGLGAAAAGATLLAVTHGGSSSDSPLTAGPSTPSSSTSTTTSTPSSFNAMAWNGTWKGDMTLKTDAKTCAGSQTSYGEVVTIALNSSGAGTFVLTDNPGFTRNYTVTVTANGTITVSTSTSFFGSPVPGTATITFGGTSSAPTLSFTEGSTFGSCTNTYASVTLTKGA